MLHNVPQKRIYPIYTKRQRYDEGSMRVLSGTVVVRETVAAPIDNASILIFCPRK